MSASGYYEIINYAAYPMGLKARVIAGNVQYNRMHWHDSLEIICCIFGSCTINTPGQCYQLQSGDLLTINGGISHEVSAGTGTGLQLIFSADPAVFYPAGDGENRYVFTTVGDGRLEKEHADICNVRASIARMCCMLLPEDEVWSKLYEAGDQRAIVEYYNNDDRKEDHSAMDEWWYQFQIELYQILVCLARHKQVGELPVHKKKMDTHFKRCIEFIHSEYDQAINARIVAGEIGFSESTVYRLFQEYMGMSFNQYLNSVRVSAACGLIEKSDCSITEISAKCGFSSLSNFYRTFQQFMGAAPRKFRKMNGLNVVEAHTAQKDLMLLNRYQPIWELPYTREDILHALAYQNLHLNKETLRE